MRRLKYILSKVIYRPKPAPIQEEMNAATAVTNTSYWPNSYLDARDHITTLLEFHLPQSHLRFKDAMHSAIPAMLHYIPEDTRIQLLLPQLNCSAYSARLDRALSAGIDVVFKRPLIHEDVVHEIPFIRVSQYVTSVRTQFDLDSFIDLDKTIGYYERWSASQNLVLSKPFDFQHAISVLLAELIVAGYLIYRVKENGGEFVVLMVQNELYVEVTICYTDIKQLCESTLLEGSKVYC